MTKPDPIPHTSRRILIVKGRTVRAEYRDARPCLIGYLPQ